MVHPDGKDLGFEKNAQSSGKNEDGDEEEEDKLPLEDGGVEEDELGIHHGAKDHECEFGAVFEVGKVCGDEGV